MTDEHTPKRIHANVHSGRVNEFLGTCWTEPNDTSTEYVRADIADELLDALKEIESAISKPTADNEEWAHRAMAVFVSRTARKAIAKARGQRGE